MARRQEGRIGYSVLVQRHLEWRRSAGKQPTWTSRDLLDVVFGQAGGLCLSLMLDMVIRSGELGS